MMYSFNVTEQLIMFLRSFAFGMLLSFFRSIIFFLSGLFLKNNNIRVIVSDIIISLFGAFSFFCFLLAFNLGKLRLYILIGIIPGIIIFRLAFGQTLDFIFEKLLCFIRRIAGIIIKPLKFIICKNNVKICKKTHKKSSQHLANKNKNVV